VSEIRFDQPNSSTTEEMEQALSRENEAYGLKHQIDKCVMETPAQLSLKDWQLAVLAEVSLQQEFDQVTAACEVQQGREMAQVNYECSTKKTSNGRKITRSQYKVQRFGRAIALDSDSPETAVLHYNQFGPRRQHDCLQLNCEQIDSSHFRSGCRSAHLRQSSAQNPAL